MPRSVRVNIWEYRDQQREIARALGEDVSPPEDLTITLSRRRTDNRLAILRADHKDTQTETWQVIFSEPVTDPVLVIFYAWSDKAVPSSEKLPPKRSPHPILDYLFAWEFQATPTDTFKAWRIRVTYTTAPFGFNKQYWDSFIDDDPTTAPKKLTVSWQEGNIEIRRAKNVDEFPGAEGGAKGYPRAAGTDGPIVNTAGAKTGQSVIRSKRYAEIEIQHSYSELKEVMDIHKKLEGTTNKDNITIGVGDAQFSAKQLIYDGYVLHGSSDWYRFDPAIGDVTTETVERATLRFRAVDDSDIEIENEGARHFKEQSAQNDAGFTSTQDDVISGEGTGLIESVPLDMEGKSQIDSTGRVIDAKLIKYEWLKQENYAEYFDDLQNYPDPRPTVPENGNGA